jgi:DNA modification methylase
LLKFKGLMKTQDLILFGDCREIMEEWIADGVKVQTCVTSPPYFGLRDYGVEGQLGLEPTSNKYIENLVGVFQLIRKLLVDDGTAWLNLGDSYGAKGGDIFTGFNARYSGTGLDGGKQGSIGRNAKKAGKSSTNTGLAPGNLQGIPWRVALALQADGWCLRQDIIWHKPNPMPESVKNRCTKSHEYIFLLSKSAKYYFNAKAIEEPAKWERWGNQTENKIHTGTAGHLGNKTLAELPIRDKKNKRSVWTIATKPYVGAHCAAFPPLLVEPCILAGSRIGDIVLDPFMGSGTTAQVAVQHGRHYLGCELNKEYKKLCDKRLKKDNQ